MVDALTDDELLLAISERRDQDAFAELHARFLILSFNVAYNITANRSLAEEAMQEAMLQVWLSAKAYKPGNARGWILRIVVRESLELARKQSKGRKRMEQERSRQQSKVPAQVADNPEQDELLRMLRSVLHELPAPDRQLLALHFGAEMTQQEIGTALAMPQQTVSFKIKKLLDDLRGRLSVAGFAVLAPALLAESISKAICSGVPAPHGLPAPDVAKTRERMVPRQSLGIPVGAAAFAVIALGCAVAFGMKTGQSVPQNPALTAQAGTDEKQTSLRWSFDAGIPDDLKTENGAASREWKWKKSPGERGQLVSDGVIALTLPVRVPERPFVMTEHFDIKGRENLLMAGACWRNERETLPHRENFKIPLWTSKNAPERIDIATYFLGRYVVHVTNGTISKICEYEKSFPSDKSMMFFQNCGLCSVEFQTLAPNDIPLEMRDTAKLLEQFKAGGATAHDVAPTELPPGW